ncbi:MAG: oxygen-independent coproporphyrinogen III oxidase [Hyphomicrobiaceae bacterium]
MCWYCACNTKAVRRYEPVADYLGYLVKEIGLVAGRMPKGPVVSHVHWGGGSPSMLKADDIGRLAGAMRQHFAFSAETEFAVEVDPRLLDTDSIAAFAAAGVNRVSIGVQDFDPAVQKAINRIQTREITESAITQFRGHGIPSINIDLVYGLPMQTVESVGRTLSEVLAMRPDRLAVFGYAHVPAKAVAQKMIDETTIAGPEERMAQFRRITEIAQEAGYRQIGIDHFALPGDLLATKPLRRNFQGYTTDDSDAIIGFGASAIGQMPEGYIQNTVPTGDYQRRIGEGRLATARGFRLSEDDRMRAHVIERLMCDFAFSRAGLVARFGTKAAPIVAEAAKVAAEDTDGFIEPTADGFRLTADGRTFVRKVCQRFDAYWGQGSATHAIAV